ALGSHIRWKKTFYSEEIKKCSATLQYYSPKAYNYALEQFNNVLPHLKTLRRWTIEIYKGIILPYYPLTYMVNNEPTEVQCNLVINKMKAALVFLLVGVNDYWKLLIGYFLIYRLSGNKRARIKLNSLTFDGALDNITIVSTLGYIHTKDSSFTIFPHSKILSKWYRNVNAEPGFTEESLKILTLKVKNSLHPIFLSLSIDEIALRQQLEFDGTGYSVSVYENYKLPIGYFIVDTLKSAYKKFYPKVVTLFDPAHMMKVIRNILVRRKYHLPNKLRKQHLLYFKPNMKVKLVTQLLSQ
ncbi:hypothetical protein AGLY_012331, partial [Aphis glycines]